MLKRILSHILMGPLYIVMLIQCIVIGPFVIIFWLIHVAVYPFYWALSYQGTGDDLTFKKHMENFGEINE